MATRYVAFLRGVNVGGKAILPMKDLKSLFEEAGCAHVATYIQSGNVVFTATAEILKTLDASMTVRIKEQYGHTTRLVIRDATQMQTIFGNNPFLDREDNPSKLHVVFLAHPPTAPNALDPFRSPPDEFRVVGQEIYLHLPNGAADTKLTNAWFDSKLKTISTARNWRTVTKMLEMLLA